MYRKIRSMKIIILIILIIISGSFAMYLINNENKKNPSILEPVKPIIVSVSINPEKPELNDEVNITAWIKNCWIIERPNSPSDHYNKTKVGGGIQYYTSSHSGSDIGHDSMKWIGGENFSYTFDPFENNSIYQFRIRAFGVPILTIPGDVDSVKYESAKSELFLITGKNQTDYTAGISVEILKDEYNTPNKGDRTISARFLPSHDKSITEVDLFYYSHFYVGSKSGRKISSHTYTFILEKHQYDDYQDIDYSFVVRFDDGSFFTSQFYQTE